MITRRAEWNVTLTSDEFSLLEPVTVRIDAGPFSMQEYLTPEQAEDLAGRLRQVAQAARDRERALSMVPDGS